MPGLKPKRKKSMDSDFESPGKQKKLRKVSFFDRYEVASNTKILINFNEITQSFLRPT